MKKKTVNKNGMNLSALSPIEGLAISSRTKMINGSSALAIPFGA